MNYIENYNRWIKKEALDNDIRADLELIKENNFEIKERFFKNLEFGTGGLRGIIGAGTNRINLYTVRKVTQGLANYINAKSSKENLRSVAIAYDSRNYSDNFAEQAALVLAANGINAYIFDSLRPTPELSFAVRFLDCEAGIVITASHNPKEYNGYKVYGSDGGQITLETANSIINEINKLDIFDDINICLKDEAIKNGYLKYIGEDLDIEYLSRVRNLSIHTDIAKKVDDFKVVYTPIHGTGLMLIKRIFSDLGYGRVHIVESQSKPDGNFPTVKSPNPEEKEALSAGIELAENIGADIVLGTDPDADRVGVAVKDSENKYILLTGNQIGALLTYYLVSSKNKLSSKDAVIKTIVTSELGSEIAKSYGASVFETLTGFKFIGEKIEEFEKNGDYDFLFGYEESYGYLAGTFVRDKDAIISSMMIVEMAAYYKSQGISILDLMDKIYKEYGYYIDELVSYSFKGIDGEHKIKSIVNKFRNIDDLIHVFPNIIKIEDYEIQKCYNANEDTYTKINLPKSNVIKVYFEDNSWFAVRPSGTEPKLKIYLSTVSKIKSEAQNKVKNLISRVDIFMK